ncbi:MAG: hypothetical protein A2W69_04935 [Gammaproteobacteria bacterium RIFCSPLOWO2_02_47_7]|nr:MAG: hypothetical protein A2W69_04935 [Gammaproteobacteria bacterium RIFCSPLOWO2_02_47_7]OGT76561.1 MAG: hypothetical protein A2W76_08900 [Gammaproteobacteria bacterium RIFCSPLOWO2_12_47_11]OGT83356.1 MAG: hypothetical protein A3G42_01280 [Gammaproteobacteria bacterium RIFCSPLOWO2_12_FULL_47_76]
MTEKKSTVNIFPIINFDYINDKIVVFNAVYDPILSLAYTGSIMSGQFLIPVRPRIDGKLFDLLRNELTIFFALDCFYFFYGGWFD